MSVSMPGAAPNLKRKNSCKPDLVTIEDSDEPAVESVGPAAELSSSPRQKCSRLEGDGGTDNSANSSVLINVESVSSTDNSFVNVTGNSSSLDLNDDTLMAIRKQEHFDENEEEEEDADRNVTINSSILSSIKTEPIEHEEAASISGPSLLQPFDYSSPVVTLKAEIQTHVLGDCERGPPTLEAEANMTDQPDQDQCCDHASTSQGGRNPVLRELVSDRPPLRLAEVDSHRKQRPDHGHTRTQWKMADQSSQKALRRFVSDKLGLTCVSCGQCFDTVQELQYHYLTQEKAVHVFGCAYCGEGHLTKNALWSHQCEKWVQFSKQSNAAQVKFSVFHHYIVCKGCGFNLAMFIGDIERNHSALSLHHTNRDMAHVIVLTHTPFEMHVTQLNIHYVPIVKGVPLNCEVCGYAYKTMKEIFSHNMSEHKLVMPCTDCSPIALCFSKMDLRHHQLSTHYSDASKLIGLTEATSAQSVMLDLHAFEADEDVEDTRLHMDIASDLTVTEAINRGILPPKRVGDAQALMEDERYCQLADQIATQFTQVAHLNVGAAALMAEFTHHIDTSTIMLNLCYCQICSKVFSHRYQLRMHLRSEHKQEITSSKSFLAADMSLNRRFTPFMKTFATDLTVTHTCPKYCQCPCCDRMLCSTLALRRHLFTQHDVNISQSIFTNVTGPAKSPAVQVVPLPVPLKPKTQIEIEVHRGNYIQLDKAQTRTLRQNIQQQEQHAIGAKMDDKISAVNANIRTGTATEGPARENMQEPVGVTVPVIVQAQPQAQPAVHVTVVSRRYIEWLSLWMVDNTQQQKINARRLFAELQRKHNAQSKSHKHQPEHKSEPRIRSRSRDRAVVKEKAELCCDWLNVAVTNERLVDVVEEQSTLMHRLNGLCPLCGVKPGAVQKCAGCGLVVCENTAYALNHVLLRCKGCELEVSAGKSKAVYECQCCAQYVDGDYANGTASVDPTMHMIKRTSSWINHMLVHHSDVYKRCVYCAVPFTWLADWLQHTHTFNQYTCSISGHLCVLCACFSDTPEELTAHMMMEAQNISRKSNVTYPMSECPICEAYLERGTVVSMWQHLKTHIVTEGRIECPLCLHTFSSCATVLNHILLTCAALPDFVCLLCNRKHLTLTELRKHRLRVHRTCYRQCEHCELTFAWPPTHQLHQTKCVYRMQAQITEELSQTSVPATSLSTKLPVVTLNTLNRANLHRKQMPIYTQRLPTSGQRHPIVFTQRTTPMADLMARNMIQNSKMAETASQMAINQAKMRVELKRLRDMRMSTGHVVYSHLDDQPNGHALHNQYMHKQPNSTYTVGTQSIMQNMKSRMESGQQVRRARERLFGNGERRVGVAMHYTDEDGHAQGDVVRHMHRQSAQYNNRKDLCGPGPTATTSCSTVTNAQQLEDFDMEAESEAIQNELASALNEYDFDRSPSPLPVEMHQVKQELQEVQEEVYEDEQGHNAQQVQNGHQPEPEHIPYPETWGEQVPYNQVTSKIEGEYVMFSRPGNFSNMCVCHEDLQRMAGGVSNIAIRIDERGISAYAASTPTTTASLTTTTTCAPICSTTSAVNTGTGLYSMNAQLPAVVHSNTHINGTPSTSTMPSLAPAPAKSAGARVILPTPKHVQRPASTKTFTRSDYGQTAWSDACADGTFVNPTRQDWPVLKQRAARQGIPTGYSVFVTRGRGRAQTVTMANKSRTGATAPTRVHTTRRTFNNQLFKSRDVRVVPRDSRPAPENESHDNRIASGHSITNTGLRIVDQSDWSQTMSKTPQKNNEQTDSWRESEDYHKNKLHTVRDASSPRPRIDRTVYSSQQIWPLARTEIVNVTKVPKDRGGNGAHDQSIAESVNVTRVTEEPTRDQNEDIEDDDDDGDGEEVRVIGETAARDRDRDATRLMHCPVPTKRPLENARVRSALSDKAALIRRLVPVPPTEPATSMVEPANTPSNTNGTCSTTTASCASAGSRSQGQGVMRCDHCAFEGIWSALMIHNLSHLTEVTDFCFSCRGNFESSYEFEKHLRDSRAHQNALSPLQTVKFECTKCDETVMTFEQSAQHMCEGLKTVLGPDAVDICGVCGLVFDSLCGRADQAYMMHVLLKHLCTQWYMCRLCGVCFKSLNHLVNHHKANHMDLIQVDKCTICDTSVAPRGITGHILAQQHLVRGYKLKANTTLKLGEVNQRMMKRPVVRID